MTSGTSWNHLLSEHQGFLLVTKKAIKNHYLSEVKDKMSLLKKLRGLGSTPFLCIWVETQWGKLIASTVQLSQTTDITGESDLVYYHVAFSKTEMTGIRFQ